VNTTPLAWMVIVIPLVTCAASQPATPPAVNPPAITPALDDAFVRRLESIDAAMAKIVDLRASFEQRKKTPLLKKELVSKGVLVSKGKAVRWETREPHATTMLVDDEGIRMYYPADKLVEIFDVGDHTRDLAGAPLPRLSLLKEKFEITEISAKEFDIAGDASAKSDASSASKPDSRLLGILLKPRDESLRRHIRSVQVLIDDSVPVANKVIMTDADGEKTTITFSDVRTNTGVKDDEIQLRLPDGVRVSRPLGEKMGKPPTEPATPAPAEPKSKPR